MQVDAREPMFGRMEVSRQLLVYKEKIHKRAACLVGEGEVKDIVLAADLARGRSSARLPRGARLLRPCLFWVHGVTQVSAKDFVFDALRPPPLTKPPVLFKVIEYHIS
jgi:hypothetical protein